MVAQFDGFEDEDEFQDDADMKSVLQAIDAVIAKRSPQEAYDWICELENKTSDRAEALAANPEVHG